MIPMKSSLLTSPQSHLSPSEESFINAFTYHLPLNLNLSFRIYIMLHQERKKSLTIKPCHHLLDILIIEMLIVETHVLESMKNMD